VDAGVSGVWWTSHQSWQLEGATYISSTECCSTALMSAASCRSLLNGSVGGKERVKRWKFRLDNFSLGPARRLTEGLEKEEWLSLWKRGSMQYSE
jgi:hypothetical protein